MRKRRGSFPLNYESATATYSTTVWYNRRWSTNVKSVFFSSGSCVSGFTVANASCCPSSRTNGLCIPNQTPCENRTTYVFWDQFHPTEAANRIIAINSYNGSDPALTYPMDIKHLVQTWMMIQFKLRSCPWITSYHAIVICIELNNCRVTYSKSSVLFLYTPAGKIYLQLINLFYQNVYDEN